jgi:hypothetical protein
VVQQLLEMYLMPLAVTAEALETLGVMEVPLAAVVDITLEMVVEFQVLTFYQWVILQLAQVVEEHSDPMEIVVQVV